MINRLIYFFTFLLIACSQFDERAYISIDTGPRGLPIKKVGKNNSVEELGSSPLFDYDQIGENRYFVGEKETTTKYQFPQPKEQCGVQWTDPLMRRIPIVGEFIPETISESRFNPLKYVKGGKLDCTYVTKLKVEQAKKLKGEICHNFIILPPPHSERKVSDDLMQAWIQNNFTKNKKQCDKVISSHAAEEYLEFLGMNHLNRYYGINYILYGRIARLAMKTQATHLVFLPYKNKEGRLVAGPEVYDIHAKSRMKNDFEETVAIAAPSSKKSFWLTQFQDSFRFIPNTLAIKLKFRQFIHLEEDENESLYSTTKTHPDMPPTPMIGNIDYPEQRWGVNFRYSPSFSYKHWDRAYDVMWASAVMALKFFGHTPMGTFQGRFGLGAAYIKARNDDTNYDESNLNGIWQYGIEYYQFVDERWFVKLGWRRTKFTENSISDGTFNLDAYSQLFVGLGYFFPELKLKIHEWLTN